MAGSVCAAVGVAKRKAMTSDLDIYRAAGELIKQQINYDVAFTDIH